VLLDRLADSLLLAIISGFRGGDPTESLALARLACDVPDEIDDAPMFAAIRGLIDGFDQYSAEHPDDRRRMTFLILAATAARTPDVPVPTSDFAPRSVEAQSA
jgi:hypothetical protein